MAQGNRTLIWGGRPANPGELPFQVALVTKASAPFAKCGGVLVRPNWVLTAGHCVDRQDLGTFIFKAGTLALDASSPERKFGGRIHTPPGFGRNESYPDKVKPYFNDLALVSLSEPFLETEIRSVKLVDSEGDESRLLRDSQAKFVAGWGMMAGNANGVRLRVTQVEAVSLGTCRTVYGDPHVNDRMLCSGDRQRNHCSGDSGGPYVADLGSSATLLGIISWGAMCDADKPGVHARILPFRAWIEACLGGACPQRRQ